MKCTSMNARIVITPIFIRVYFAFLVYVSCSRGVKANGKYSVFRDSGNEENLNCVCETQNIVSINLICCVYNLDKKVYLDILDIIFIQMFFRPIS